MSLDALPQRVLSLLDGLSAGALAPATVEPRSHASRRPAQIKRGGDPGHGLITGAIGGRCLRGIEPATRYGPRDKWWAWITVDLVSCNFRSVACQGPRSLAWALRSRPAMRVHVVAESGWNSAQARAYAEYRLFAALARYGSVVQGAQIVLRREGDEGPRAFRCRMTVSLVPDWRCTHLRLRVTRLCRY